MADPSREFVDRFNGFLEIIDQLEREGKVKTVYDEVLQAHFDHIEEMEQDFGNLWITLKTDEFRPNHSVAIQEEDASGPHLFHGVYDNGAWLIKVPHVAANPVLRFRFVLNGCIEHDGDPLEAREGLPNIWAMPDKGGGITFPGANLNSCKRHDYNKVRLDVDALSQFHFPRNTREDEEYEFIVIGGGMMGGVLADALSDRGKSTLVLEMGVPKLMTHAANLYRDVDPVFEFYQSGVSDISGPFLGGPNIMLGGRSQFWSGVIPRLLEFEGDLGWWPDEIIHALFGKNGSPHYYERAESTLKRINTRGGFAKTVVGLLRRRLFEDNIEISELPTSFDIMDLSGPGNFLHPPTGIFSAADLLKDSIDTLDPGHFHLRINTGHMALRVLTNGDRAVGVECYDLLTNRTRTYRGKNIVMALGNIGSPKLALDSNLQDSSGLIGVGLTDHPEWVEEGGGDFLLPPGHRMGGRQSHARLYLKKSPNHQPHFPFHCEITINSRYWAARFVDPDLWDAYTSDEGKYSRVTIKFHPPVPLNDQNRVTSPGIGKRAKIQYHGYQVPFPNGEGKAWEFKNSVWEAILGNSSRNYTDIRSRWDEKGTIQHACGTLRMDSGSRGGVVDTDLRFHEYQNLYCCDASVLPCVPSANPSLTVVALTLRLADHLAP